MCRGATHGAGGATRRVDGGPRPRRAPQARCASDVHHGSHKSLRLLSRAWADWLALNQLRTPPSNFNTTA
jgi:hypothetical protein